MKIGSPDTNFLSSVQKLEEEVFDFNIEEGAQDVYKLDDLPEMVAISVPREL